MGWLFNRNNGSKTKEGNEDDGVEAKPTTASEEDDDIVSLEQAFKKSSGGESQQVTTIVVPYVHDNDLDQPQNTSIHSSGSGSLHKPAPSCCYRFSVELSPCQKKSSWFSVTDKGTGRDIDIPESFAPASCYAFLFKVACAVVAIGTLVYGFLDTEHPEFYLAYLTNWGQVVGCLYFLFSVLNTVLASRTPQAVTWRISITWVLFEIAAQSCTIIAILFWGIVYKPDEWTIDYLTVAPHGAILALILIDGLLVNRIPVRWVHWYVFVLPFGCAFIVWTVIQSFTGIGNPDRSDNDPTTNDDAIYEHVMEWDDDWQTALFWSCITIFVIGPAIYGLLWSLSVGFCCCKDRRKYVDSVDETDQRPTVNDVEEGSLFQQNTGDSSSSNNNNNVPSWRESYG